MGEAAKSPGRQNYYDGLFDRLLQAGLSHDLATIEAAEAYLDGRPSTLGKHKTTRKERDRWFWTSAAVNECPHNIWQSEPMALALARYLGQEPVGIDGLLARVADIAPETLARAVRYSGLVLIQHSPRSTELRNAAVGHDSLIELCKVLDTFDGAYRERVALVEMLKASLAGLSTFDLLLYASLYAFERLVPTDLHRPASSSVDTEIQTAWDAIGDLLTWKLRTTPEAAQALSDDAIGASLVQNLRPILFNESGLRYSQALETLSSVGQLIDAQIELNEFIGRSANAFSYDDGIRFERRDQRLEIVEVDDSSRSAWHREARKLECLHGYWFYRALDDFLKSDAARERMGHTENEDANRLA